MTAPATAAPAPAPASAPPPNVTPPERATFTANGKTIPVHFNPVSLQISLSNNIDSSPNQDKAQYVSKSSSKLTMDLIFDTTDKGTDVRNDTGQIAAFMDAQGADQAHRAPPTVVFRWGTFSFQGIVESYRETVDFFSHDGVPLRASVNLTMAAQTIVFSADNTPQKSTAVDVPSSAGNASQIASAGGNPNAGRGLAAANGLASMRFSSGPLTVDASVKLGGPVAFASAGVGAGAGFGISGGASLGISGGASLGISGGASFGIGGGASLGIGGGASLGITGGAGIGISGPVFGGSASAGVPATLGAFAGLRANAVVTGPALDPMRLLPQAPPAVVAVGPQASFGIGGRALASGSASFGTDVGAGVSAQARVRFDGGG